MIAPQLITEKEAAGLLRVSRRKVQTLLPRVRLSARGTRYDAADLLRLIESKKEAQ